MAPGEVQRKEVVEKKIVKSEAPKHASQKASDDASKFGASAVASGRSAPACNLAHSPSSQVIFVNVSGASKMTRTQTKMCSAPS